MGLHCWMGFSLVAVSGGRCPWRCVFIAEWAFLQLRRVGAALHCAVWASRCSGVSCYGGVLQGAWDSVVVARGLSSPGAWLSCSGACRIFPDQGSNPWLLHQQVDFLPPSHQWSSEIVFLVFPRSLYLFPWPSFSHSILPSCSQFIWFITIKNNNAPATPTNSQDWLCNDFVPGTLLNVSGASSHSVLTVCMSMAKERWTIWKFDFDLCQHPLLFLCGGKIRVSHAPVGACIPHRPYRGPLCVVIP